MIGAIREYFLLSDARATAKLVPEDARVALDRQLALGRQRAEAADALWSNGHVAEGLRLAADAFDATLAAVAPFADAVARPERAQPMPAPSEPEREASADETEPSDAEGEAREAEASSEPGDDASEGEAAAGAKAEPSEGEPEASASDALASEAASDTEASDAQPSDTEEASAAHASDAEASGAEPAAAAGASAPKIAPTARPAEGSLTEPEWAVTLRRRGLAEGKTRDVIEAARARASKTLPQIDDEVSASDGELFQQLVTARRHVDRALAPASMTPGQLGWTRVSRIGFASFLVVAIAAGLYLLLRPPTGVSATASGQWSAEFTPDRAVDGDEATEWLLPDRQSGWVDLRISPPEHVGTLRLKNSHNRHYNDRATHEYEIQVFSNGRVVKTIQGSWQGIAPRPEWTEHEVGADAVERIRINVRSWHRNGGGLAEIDWD